MPFNINGWELVLLVVLALILFGPDRLPEIAVQAGKLIREVRKASQAATSEITREFESAAREAGTSTEEIRAAGEAARRVVQDTSRAVSAVVGGAGVREIGAAVSSAADAARGTPGGGTGSAATAAGSIASTDATDAAPAGSTPDTSAPQAGTDESAGGLEVVDSPASPELAEPIDVDMLARRIAPFDLESGGG